jgi:hypothetical protein
VSVVLECTAISIPEIAVVSVEREARAVWAMAGPFALLMGPTALLTVRFGVIPLPGVRAASEGKAARLEVDAAQSLATAETAGKVAMEVVALSACWAAI